MAAPAVPKGGASAYREARRRLILTGEPLRSVAAASGFYDQPHLIRHFKRILGVSPKAFAPASTSQA